MADFDKLEELGLSKEAMEALREHLEQHESTNDTVEEDWHLSQFWYDDNTREKVAKEAHDHANGGNIAIISAPSIYQSYIKMYSENSNVYLFEFDERFQMYGENFVFYDFNHPTEIPEKLHNKFTYIIIDPPYLTEDCFEGFVETIKLLSKYKAADKILCRLCVLTGAVQEEVVFKYLQCKPTTFTPTFANKLANEFYCYVNYKSDLGEYLPDVQ